MASAVAQNNHISIQKSLFGLVQKAVYTPTGSPVDAFQLDYSQETAASLTRLLSAPAEELKSVVDSIGHLPTAHIGNVRLELCLSRDHQFAAMQLFRYADFDYRPDSGVRILEGSDAETVGQLF